MLNLFEHVHYPSFLLSSSNLMNLVPDGLLLSLALMPKLKRPWRQVWALQLCSRPPLMQGFRVLFWMWIIWKVRNIILFKKKKKKEKKWQKKTSAMHTHFVLWTVIFLFLLTFYAVNDSLKLDSHLPVWLTIKYNTHIAQYLMN